MNPESTSTSAYFTEVSSFPVTLGDSAEAPPEGGTVCRGFRAVGAGAAVVVREDGRSQTLTLVDGVFYEARVATVTSFAGTALQIYW